jgi:hypothetical protein
MALRYSSLDQTVLAAGTTFNPGLTYRAVGTAPTEWAFNYRGLPSAGSLPLYLLSAPTSVAFIVCAGSAASSQVDVFCSVPHTIVAV